MRNTALSPVASIEFNLTISKCRDEAVAQTQKERRTSPKRNRMSNNKSKPFHKHPFRKHISSIFSTRTMTFSFLEVGRSSQFLPFGTHVTFVRPVRLGSVQFTSGQVVRLLRRLVPVVCMVVNWIPGQMALFDPPMTSGVFTSFLVWQLRPTRDCGKSPRRPSPMRSVRLCQEST